MSKTLLEKVETVLSEALSARFDVLKAKTAPKNIEPNQFIVTGFSEIGNGYHSRMDSVSALINESLNRIDLKDENNVVSVRRFCKPSKPDSTERRLCRLLLIKSNNHHFTDKCFTCNHKLQSFKFSV